MVMKYTELLADFISTTSWPDLPDDAIQRSKWAMVDGIAVTFAGIPHEVGRSIIAFVKELGGKPTSTILGDGHRTSPPWAAYANGTLSHAIDYDDTNYHMGGHPTAPLLAAILAVGEKVRASGKDLLLSYILGLEVETKIGLTINKVHYNLGWHPTATLGTLGAAAACAKVMNLNREQILMALGMAGSQASALKQNFGTMTKPLHVGQAAKNGVLSALLASKGWTADREILEGHFGFCNLFAGRGLYDLKDMSENLGKPFDILEPGVQIKKYPCCGSTHPTLDALSNILKEHTLQPDEIVSVESDIHPDRIHVLLHPDPKTDLEAKFSLQYCIATMILNKGRVSITDFTEERVTGDVVHSFLPKIKVTQQPSLKPWHVRLRIRLRDGQVIEKEGGESPGITAWDELVEKYEDCLEPILPTKKIQKSLRMIQEIEKIDDISELMKALVAKGK
jgi:2-methylcitrate dehydratase PrpD